MGEKIKYDTIFGRSFSRYVQKKLGYGAFLGCLLLASSFCTVFKPQLGPLSVRKYPIMYVFSFCIYNSTQLMVEIKKALTPLIFFI